MRSDSMVFLVLVLASVAMGMVLASVVFHVLSNAVHGVNDVLIYSDVMNRQ